MARISDCQDWHTEYCELYWKLNELQLIGNAYAYREARKVLKRMDFLIACLGYTPEA